MIGKFSLVGKEWRLDFPDRCPHCYHHSELEIISVGKSPERNECGVVFFCNRCKHISFADLALSGIVLNDSSTKLIASYPNPEKSPLPEGIEVLFPAFCKIFAEAHRAELEGLHEITGMAYRKAVEFLVKDYLIDSFPELRQEILNEPLGKSISRIEYPRIKALAKISSWIGNDETHYIKKNPDLSVADMKNFIIALCHLILAEKVGDTAIDYILQAR